MSTDLEIAYLKSKVTLLTTITIQLTGALSELRIITTLVASSGTLMLRQPEQNQIKDNLSKVSARVDALIAALEKLVEVGDKNG